MTNPLLVCDPCRKPTRHKDDGLVRINDHKGRHTAYDHMYRCQGCGARRVWGQYTVAGVVADRARGRGN